MLTRADQCGSVQTNVAIEISFLQTGIDISFLQSGIESSDQE